MRTPALALLCLTAACGAPFTDAAQAPAKCRVVEAKDVKAKKDERAAVSA